MVKVCSGRWAAPCVVFCVGVSLAFLLGSSALAPAAAQTAPASDLVALFNPVDDLGQDLVPLSEFVQSSVGLSQTLHVRAELFGSTPEVLRIAEFHPATQTVRLYVPAAVVLQDGLGQPLPFAEFTHTTVSGQAFLVVVHPLLTNRFAGGVGMVTHWKRDATGSDGSWSMGATDGITDVDIVNGQYTQTQVGGEDMPPALPPTPYFWNSAEYSFFEDSTGSHSEAMVPSYERYMAEDWSLKAYTKLAMIRFSDRVRAYCGIPIGFRNYTDDSEPLAEQDRLVDDDLPIFQLLANYVVTFDDPAHEGSENCLASFILPPHWSSTASPGHPVLFNSGYDTTSVLRFSNSGKVFFSTLADVYLANPNHKVVGVLTNGGGARSTVGVHGSAIHTMNKLFAEVTGPLALDLNTIVSSGFSRGGTAELALWGHPDLDPSLRVVFMLTSSPITYPADTLLRYANPTYALVQTGLQESTGYTASITTGWENPDQAGQTGPELAAYNLLGTTAPELFDATQASGSSTFVQNLKDRGTTVLFKTGTHDPTKPFAHMVSYIEKLEQFQVPYRFDVEFRLGHKSTQPYPREADLLQWAIDGLPLTDGGIHYHHPAPGDELGTPITHEFEALRAPVVVEAPLVTELGARSTFSIVGPPGMLFLVQVQHLGEPAWLNQIILPLNPQNRPLLLTMGVLTSAAPWSPVASFTHDAVASNDPVDLGPWEYQTYYMVPGESLRVLTSETSVPPSNPVFDNWPSFYVGSPTGPARFSVDSRTGGVSEDTLFHPDS